MSRKRSIKILYVYMNGEDVGSLTRRPTGDLEFLYSSSWLENKNARPISLSMPLSESQYRGDTVYNFFENLLPDNKEILERIQARYHANSTRCFDLLTHIGRDCVGALQLLTQNKKVNVHKVDADPISSKSISKLLREYRSAPLGMGENSDFRISIAGAQEKTALLWHKKKWHRPKGTTPTSHIIKLPIGYIKHTDIDLRDSVENEWLCLKILSAYDIPVNLADIQCFENIKTLVVKRFDRRWSNDKSWLIRLPQEDMCQALGVSPGLKYESDGGPGIREIMEVLQGSFDPATDRRIFMKSIFLFWILGAIDGHAKNFSIRIKAKGHYRLTPLYDVMSGYPLVEKKQLELKKMKMAMGLKSKNKHYHWHKMQRRHWLAMAGLCKFDEAEMDRIIDEACDQTQGVIDAVSKSLPSGFPSEIAEPIFRGIKLAKDKCSKLVA